MRSLDAVFVRVARYQGENGSAHNYASTRYQTAAFVVYASAWVCNALVGSVMLNAASSAVMCTVPLFPGAPTTWRFHLN